MTLLVLKTPIPPEGENVTAVHEAPAGDGTQMEEEAPVEADAPAGVEEAPDEAAVENIPAGGEVAVVEDPQIGVADPVGNNPSADENEDGSPPAGLLLHQFPESLRSFH